MDKDRYREVPPLRALHEDSILSQVKLATFRALSTDELVKSLLPGMPGALKARPDGTMLDGHHRIAILKARAFVVDALPREVINKQIIGEESS